MTTAILGLAAAGRTTVFNALTRSAAPTGSYGASKGLNVGVGDRPDTQLDTLERVFSARNKVRANLELWDTPTDYSTDDVFPRETVNSLQRTKCLLLVVRAFDDPSVPHPNGEVAWQRDLETLLFDIVFADIELIHNRIERISVGMKALKSGDRATATRNIETLEQMRSKLEDGVALRSIELSEAESRAISGTFTLSSLPVVVAVNIGERDMGIASTELERESRTHISESLIDDDTRFVPVCAQLEEELRQMDEDESHAIRRELYGARNASDDLMSECLNALRMETFYTASEKEVRAWHFSAGSTASQAAGIVHSDMERGFIRAEVVSFDAFAKCGSMKEARKSGALRQEGRDYIFKDGDIANFLFSV